jgi:FkbM family methyltransferase
MTDNENANEKANASEPEEKSDQLHGRSAVIGTLVGLVAGVAIGVVAVWPIQGEQAQGGPTRAAPMRSGAPRGSARRPLNAPSSSAAAGEEPLPPGSIVHPSYAQQGEDLVMAQILLTHGVKKPTYLDIGAHDPVSGNNTFWFYRRGGHGVLVEPNPMYVAKLKQVRPRDVVLEVGVGVTDQAEADYYVIEGDGQLNTFSKKQVESLEKTHHLKVVTTLKRRLVKIDEILDQNFKDGAPDILSIDVEGLDYDILKTVDFGKWRPHVVCVETSEVETGKVEKEILELLEKNGYAVRGGSFVNTVFLDERWNPPKAP